jgi:hypothetical protein
MLVALVSLLLLVHARQLAGAEPAATEPAADGEPPRSLPPTWERAGRGLSLYRAGILLNIGATILGLLLVRAAASGASSGDMFSAMQAIETVKQMLVISTVLTFLVSVVALVGLVKYAGLPWESGGRGLAHVGLGGYVAGMLLGGVTVALTVHAASSGSIWALVDLQKDQLPVVQAVTVVVGIVTLVALLRSLAATARHLGLDDLAARTRALTIGVLIVGPVLGLVRAFAREIPVALLLIAAVPGLIGALLLLVTYIKLLGRLSSEILTRVALR